MTYLKILSSLLLFILPLFVLIRDWKFHDKRTKKHHKITRVIIVLWFITGISAAFFVWADSNEISTLQITVNDLKDKNIKLAQHHDAKIDKLAKTVAISINANCINDLKNLKEIISKTHQKIFASSDIDSEKWANYFIRRIEEKKDNTTNQYRQIKEMSDRALPYFLSLTDYTLKLFDKTVIDLSDNNININHTKYDSDIESNLTASQDSRILIRKAIFSDSTSIELWLHNRIIQSGILRDHPKLEFTMKTKDSVKLLFKVKGPLVRYGNEGGSTTFADYRPIKDIIYSVDSDPLLDTTFRNELLKKTRKAFEIVYSKSQ